MWRDQPISGSRLLEERTLNGHGIRLEELFHDRMSSKPRNDRLCYWSWQHAPRSGTIRQDCIKRFPDALCFQAIQYALNDRESLLFEFCDGVHTWADSMGGLWLLSLALDGRHAANLNRQIATFAANGIGAVAVDEA